MKRYRMPRVNGITQFLTVATHTTLLTLLRQHSPDGTTRTRRYTSNIAHYASYRPLMDERLSWHSWLTYSGRFTHISGHPSAAGRAWNRKVRRSKTNVLPLCHATSQTPRRTTSRQFSAPDESYTELSPFNSYLLRKIYYNTGLCESIVRAFALQA